MRAVFARPGFPRLYAALTTSMFGDSVMLLVLSIWVKTLTGSNGLAGLTFFFLVVPALGAPWLGAWVDRHASRSVLLWGNLASALVVLPLLLVRDRGDVWLIWVVGFLYGISFIVLPAALNGLLKDLLPDDALVEANAALQTTKEAFRLVGPLVGAGLFAGFGGWAVALLDAASFLVAGAVIAGLPRPAVDEAAAEPLDVVEEAHDVMAGVRFLVRDEVLRPVMTGFAITLLVIGFFESSIFALLDAFGRPATAAGLLLTVQGVGALVGGVSSSSIVRRLGETGACVLGLALLALATAGTATATSMLAVYVWVVPFGISLPIILVALMTLVQRRSPREIMGRVSGAVEVVLSGPQALSLAGGAVLVSLLDYRTIYWIIAAAITVGALAIAVPLRGRIVADWRAARAVAGRGDGSEAGERAEDQPATP